MALGPGRKHWHPNCSFNEGEFQETIKENTFAEAGKLEAALVKDDELAKKNAQRQKHRYYNRGSKPAQVAANPVVLEYLRSQQEMINEMRSKYYRMCPCDEADAEKKQADDKERKLQAHLSKANLNLSVASSTAEEIDDIFGTISDTSESETGSQVSQGSSPSQQKSQLSKEQIPTNDIDIIPEEDEQKQEVSQKVKVNKDGLELSDASSDETEVGNENGAKKTEVEESSQKEKTEEQEVATDSEKEEEQEVATATESESAFPLLSATLAAPVEKSSQEEMEIDEIIDPVDPETEKARGTADVENLENFDDLIKIGL